MKNIKNFIILFSIIGASFSSCTDLETEEFDSIISETETGDFTGDPAELLASAYGLMHFSVTHHEFAFSFNEHSSDELIAPTRGTDWDDAGKWRALHQHTWDADHPHNLPTWNNLNQGSFTCNQVLAVNPTPQQAAEARFLRAFYMFNIMDLWGVVPFREVNDGPEIDPTVFTREEAFNFIIDDLEAALPNLPVSGPSANNIYANRAAANALLAKLYLNKAVYLSENPAGPYNFEVADMNKVVEYAEAVAEDGYSLSDDYFKIFSGSADQEVIWASNDGPVENRWRMTLHYDNNPDGWNGFATLSEFYDKFEETDSRRGGSGTSGLGQGFLIGQQYNEQGQEIINSRNNQPLSFTREVPLNGAASDQGIRVIKYHPDSALHYVMLRYADVLLMKAEAIFRGATGGDALAIVNELRTNRGASTLASLSEEAILDERGRELYWEGWRRMDQIRFGTFNDAWHEKEVTDPHTVILPIPRQAIDTNPNFVQNPGY